MCARLWLQFCGVLIVFGLLSCGSSSKSSTASSSSSPTAAVSEADACNCTPDEPASTDYRHDAKHVPLPSSTGQDITVSAILGWAAGTAPDFNAPRSGIENQMFHIANAYVQFIWLVPNDCDIHMEISDTPSKTAPRMIVETPIDSEYCPTRQAEISGLNRYSAPVSTSGFETAQGIPVEVVGLAFRDFDHQRGTQYVATQWELHPALVTVK